MDVHLKVWRFRSGVLQYRSSTNPSEDLDLAALKLPEAKKTALQPDDWVIQRQPRSRRGQPTTDIQPENVVAVIPNAKVPRWAEIWHYDGTDVRRVYRRRSASQGPETAQARTDVTALCDGDEEMVILYCGSDATSYVYLPSTDRMEAATLDETDFHLTAGQQAAGSIFDEEDVLLATLCKRLSKVRDKLAYIDRARAAKEPGLLRIAREAAEEVLSGAEPAPVQGHNVLHGVPSLCENLDKVISVCTGRQNLSQVNDVNGQSFQSGWGGTSGANAQGFGQGISLVDGAWQACGTLVALVRSCFDMKDILKLDEEERAALHGGDPIKRKALDIGTHLAKGVSTGASIADAIMKVTTVASTVPTQIVPVVGIVTGLVATVRSSVQAEKSRRRARRLRNVLAGNRGVLPQDVGDLIGYGMRKASRKHKFKALEATTAALGAAGATVLLVGAIIAGANAWNPVGWGIGALVVVAGAGLLIYKLVRRKTSADRARKRGFTRADYPKLLVRRFLKAFSEAPSSLSTECLAATLEAYGVDTLSLVMGGDEQIDLACGRIGRHLKS